MKRIVLATALLLTAPCGFAWAQAQADHDAHHPPTAPAPAPTQSTPPAQPGMGDMPMMNMMGRMIDHMSMMNMMRSMRMMTPGTSGMATIDRVEGRIAFLRTELKITEPQAAGWNTFADALRANAKKLAEVRTTMTPQQAPTLMARLDLQERWMTARLEGTRTIKSALSKLYESLSDDQKKSADELLAPHIGMGMMAMMPAEMGPGRMQPGQMGPGMGPGQMRPTR